jgi:hypothetical protein
MFDALGVAVGALAERHDLGFQRVPGVVFG